MKKHIELETLLDYLSNELTQKKIQEVENHIKECSQCTQLLLELNEANYYMEKDIKKNYIKLSNFLISKSLNFYLKNIQLSYSLDKVNTRDIDSENILNLLLENKNWGIEIKTNLYKKNYKFLIRTSNNLIIKFYNKEKLIYSKKVSDKEYLQISDTFDCFSINSEKIYIN